MWLLNDAVALRTFLRQAFLDLLNGPNRNIYLSSVDVGRLVIGHLLYEE
jgi:hypothetical protein